MEQRVGRQREKDMTGERGRNMEGEIRGSEEIMGALEAERVKRETEKTEREEVKKIRRQRKKKRDEREIKKERDMEERDGK